MEKRTAEQFQRQVELYKITKWPIHSCSICNYPCAYVFKAGLVGYDSGCNCGKGQNITLREWEDVASHYNMQTNEEYIAVMDNFWKFNLPQPSEQKPTCPTCGKSATDDVPSEANFCSNSFHLTCPEELEVEFEKLFLVNGHRFGYEVNWKDVFNWALSKQKQAREKAIDDCIEALYSMVGNTDTNPTAVMRELTKLKHQ